MRYLLGLMCVCALVGTPLTGCSEDGGAGGGAGNGGGGDGGGGTGGGGDGGGGTGGDPCADIDCGDGNPCTMDACDSADGSCSNEAHEDGTSCMIGLDPGACASGVCTALCDLVDCSDGNECTENLCNPADGSCDNPERPDGAECDFDGAPGRCTVGVCQDAGLCAEVDCGDGNECTEDVCDPGEGVCSNPNRPDGSACDDGDGACSGGSCSVRKIITVGCTNNVTENISILDWELWVSREGDIVGGESFEATLDGIAFFAEDFLDRAQAAIPAGVKKAGIFELAATVSLRSGGSGDPVTLGPIDVPYTCSFDGASCDPANDDPGGARNPDCEPYSPALFNPCLRFVDLPITTDCDACDTLGPPKDTQCAQTGFCITGPLPLELEAQTATYTPAASGEMLFGWDDQNTGATVEVDGKYLLPPAIYTDPPEPNGVRVFAVLQAAVQCTMAVDSDGPDGVGVPDAASPTPDSALLSLPIQ